MIKKKILLRILRYTLFLVAVIIVTYWFPRYGGLSFDHTVGQPWKGGNLVAKYTFAIEKPEAELAKERQKIIEEVPPFYKLDEDGKEFVLKSYQIQFGSAYKKFQHDSSSARSLSKFDSIQLEKAGERIIEAIYKKGIIQPGPGDKSLTAGSLINYVEGNEVKERKLGSFYTQNSAMLQVRDTAKYFIRKQPKFIASLVNKLLEPNIYYDSITTAQVRADALDVISTTYGGVLEGERIVSQGEIVTLETSRKLMSYQKVMEQMAGIGTLRMVRIGYFILTSLLFFIFATFLLLFAPEVFNSLRKLIFILLLVTIMILITGWSVRSGIPNYYVLPFCIVPIILRTFFGTRLALYAHLLVVLLSGYIVPLGIEYVTLNIVAGMVAIFTNMRAHYWSQFFISIGFIFLTFCIGYLGIYMVQEGSLQDMDWSGFGWLGLNVFFTLLAYPLILVFERLFGYLSDITLMELNDLGKPLLKQLAHKANGTLQHSLQVSNLSQAGAAAIGANALLVRTAALYHDIGKMENPAYFIENQHSGYNPHDGLPFEKSAEIIINHVPKGVELARKHRLPKPLISFIQTHHGTSRVEYFYRSYIQSFPEKDVDEAKFRYPGPKPWTKEQAVLMLADIVEAASRSLKEHTQENINELVDSLIDRKLQNGQLSEADITFKEVNTIRRIFKNLLHSIYHVRIEYPDQDKEKVPPARNGTAS